MPTQAIQESSIILLQSKATNLNIIKGLFFPHHFNVVSIWPTQCFKIISRTLLKNSKLVKSFDWLNEFLFFLLKLYLFACYSFK